MRISKCLVNPGWFFIPLVLLILVCTTRAADADMSRGKPTTSPPPQPLHSMAPGYCPSSGGSHEYEYILNVTTVQTDNTMSVTVEIYIANPTGCTSGSPCPEYDDSPEYINVWIDWDGDQVWEGNEKVMDVALSGYLGINYYGTMKWTEQATIPPTAVNTTWLRANLGWGHDPNDPCETNWIWGDVHDQEVTIEKSTVRVKQLVSTWDVNVDGVSNPIWSQAYNPATGDPVGTPEQKPVCDAISSGYHNRKLFLTATLEAFPAPMPQNINTECSWIVHPHDPTTGAAVFGTSFFSGSTGYAEIALPGRIGIYTIDMTFTFKDDDNTLGVQDVEVDPLFIILTDQVNIPRPATRLATACSWINGADDPLEVCQRTYQKIYSQNHWTYEDDGADLWDDLLDGTATRGNCVDYSNLWHNLCMILGVPGTISGQQQRYYGLHGRGFVTPINTTALDGNPGNAYPKGSGFTDRDRWSFGMHQVGKYLTTYYDPTFGKTYLSHTDYVDWNTISRSAYPVFGFATNCVAQTTDNKYYNLETKNILEIIWGIITNTPVWAKVEYDGPFDQPPLPSFPLHPEFAALDNVRLNRLSTYVADAWFAGECGDSAIDLDDDGIVNTLLVRTDIEVAADDTFAVIGTLIRDGQLVCSRTSHNVSTYIVGDIAVGLGTHTLSLYFSGEDIHQSQLDGPYEAKLLLLDGDGLVIDSATCVTTAYTHSQFGEIPARALGCIGEGIDVDGNMLFDSLRVGITFQTSVAGTYSISGILSSDTAVIAYMDVTAAFTVGDTIVHLSYNGDVIHESQTNGPFLNTIIVYDSAGTPIHQTICATAAYDCNDFEPKKGKVGGHLDHGQDFNSNGLFDVLTVGSLVSVEVAGNYRLSGWLSDSLGREIGFAETLTSLMPGPDTIFLDYDGVRIFENGVDGPYVVSYLSLEKEDGTVLDDERDNYTTGWYSCLSFERPAMPLIALTGLCEDYGTDTDADGLFDILTVGIQVTCRDSGVAVAQARLLAGDGEEISWASGFTAVATNEPAFIPIEFDGRFIYGCLQDGPYHIVDVLAYHTGNPDESAHQAEACLTAAYNRDAFEPAAVIAGSVFEAGLPVEGALLSVETLDYDYTNAAGEYNLTIVNSGAYALHIDPPEGTAIDTWQIFVNDVFVGESDSVIVDVLVGIIVQVDFRTGCDCTDYCELDGEPPITLEDVAYIVNFVYKQNDARPILPLCPGDNGDWNCDGRVDPLDVIWYVQYVYKSSGVGPCDPCNCDSYPGDCPPYP